MKLPHSPNILLIMSDMQRWDALGCYGNVFVRTPNIDRLAGSGTRFTRCFTPFPLCTPARATLWTIRSAAMTGARRCLFSAPPGSR